MVPTGAIGEALQRAWDESPTLPPIVLTETERALLINAAAPEMERTAREVLAAWDMEADTPERNQEERLAAAIDALRAVVALPTGGEG